MIDRTLLLTDLQGLVSRLEHDIRERVSTERTIDVSLRNEHAEARQAGRTAAPFEVFRDDLVTQSAVAWVLGGVFVRFLEDNAFLDEPDPYVPGGLRPRRLLAGATPDLLQLARDHSTAFFEKHPAETEREYFFALFLEMAVLPGMAGLYDERHNLLWRLTLSGDGARGLLDFWRKLDPETGFVRHDFTDSSNDTRFLGDLYQDLSASARDKYALLQTPEFVEEFILDHTLEPAIAEFGYQAVRLIDPTCGSGHFLLGGFRRLLDRWMHDEPGTHAPALVQRALVGVYGVDLNPFAIAIARFRLLIAAVRASGVSRLAAAPDFRINLAAGDSLLHGPRFSAIAGTQASLDPDKDPLRHVYLAEDRDELRRILGQQYHAVVGNPPYITVKDRALNDAYRQKFGSCHMKYSLAVPFMERFFELALPGRRDGETGAAPAGLVGMITSNSFMKREFGKKLIEGFIPRWDLTHVLDASGAYIPGHATPTVILFGRNQSPVGATVRAVMGIRGEPTTPTDPSRGHVWSAIVSQVDQPGSSSDWVSTSDVDRAAFLKHPWSIGGGGAAELKGVIDAAGTCRLGDKTTSIGFASFPGLDDPFVQDWQTLVRRGVEPGVIRRYVVGEIVRDWSIVDDEQVLAPYDAAHSLLPLEPSAGWARHLWPFRTSLGAVRDFGGKTRAQCGDPWWGWYRWVPSKYRVPLSIAFANVATHNHFVLDRGRVLFNAHAPVIKLPAGQAEEVHLGLLGVLNSSTACFWMKQVFYPKATAVGDVSTEKGLPEANRYEFAGTGLESFPLCSGAHLERMARIARELDRLAADAAEGDGGAFVRARLKAAKGLRATDIEQAEERWTMMRRRMIALQEELDWACYRAYGLTQLDADFACLGDERRQVDADHRPFAWSDEVGPALEPVVRDVYRARRGELRRNSRLTLIETPVFKRLWLGRQGVFGHQTASFRERASNGLRTWLLDRLESTRFWPLLELQSCAQLADRARVDPEFMQVAELLRRRADFDVAALVTELVESEAVPFLPVLRYGQTGLRKRALWERTWDIQRREDAGEDVGVYEAPPKYRSADFLKGSYSRLRGPLDVAKERFVSYPGCSRATDPTLVVAWAGWDALQQARALGAYYVAMKEQDSWRAARLAPLLAGILELLPWLEQWHNAHDPDAGMGMGDYFKGFVSEEARSLGLTTEALRAWRPANNRSKGAHKKKPKDEGDA